MYRFFSFLTISSLVVFGFLFGGCGEESTTSPSINPDGAIALVDSANEALENVLFDEINGENPEKPSDINVSIAYNLYVRALELDPNNIDANFGAGILEIVMLTQDSEINEFYSKVEEYSESGGFFDVEGMEQVNGFPNAPGPEFRINVINLPIGMPVRLTRKFCNIASESTPTINEIQNIFLNIILPRFNRAIDHLGKVTEKNDFTFNVTPKMQGDENEDPIELDLTEIYASLAALQVQKAYFLHFCAYNFNFDEYTGEEMLSNLTQGSDFMALHPEGADRMRNALQGWKDAMSSLDSGIDFLESETDNQSDDLIRIDPSDGIVRKDLDTLKYYLPKIERALNSSEPFTFEINAVDREITVSLQSFYNSPITDFKALYPAYTVALDTQSVDWDYIWIDSSATESINFSGEEGYHRWERSRNYENGETTYNWENVDFYCSELELVWDELERRIRNKPWASLRIRFSDNLSAGNNNISYSIYYSYERPTEWRYIPRITWEADSFEEWILPDPTFGGLFPNMTDQRFKEIFEITAEGWEKTVTMELW